MPKIITDQLRRERALMGSVARGQVLHDLPHDIDVAAAIGVNEKTYSRHKHDGFASMKLKDFCRLVSALGLTGRDVCEAVGVAYECKE